MINRLSKWMKTRKPFDIYSFLLLKYLKSQTNALLQALGNITGETAEVEMLRAGEDDKDLHDIEDIGSLFESLHVLCGKNLRHIKEWREQIGPTNARATVDETALTETGDGE